MDNGGIIKKIMERTPVEEWKWEDLILDLWGFTGYNDVNENKELVFSF